MKPTNWIITISFPDMPADATTLTMRKFILTALEIFGMCVAYEIKKIEQVKK